jgi:GTP-binding protein
MKPQVVIVGRPNVGKSTLFNRFVGGQVAIVEDRPGITRDRKTHDANWLGREFSVTDTGGWMPGGSELDEKVSRQVEAAVKSADLVLFVVDASVGATDDDERIATWLRRTGRPVLVVANKADNDRRESDRWSFLSLGLGEPYPVSALHGRRAGDLLDVVVAELGITDEDETFSDIDIDIEEAGEANPDLEGVPRVAIVGRPNVGKSTLFNRLCGEERSVVHDMAGTTRDAIDTLIETDEGRIVLVDTAGMRRRTKIDDSAEYYSLVRALRAVDEADVALLVVDATQGVTSQDQRLAERIDAAGSPLILVMNKWDLLDTEAREEVSAEIGRKLYFIGDAPVLRISALSGKGVHRLMPILSESIEQYQRRVPTRDVNRVIAEAQQRQPAAGGARVLYALQGAADPPTFTLFVNRELPATYLRYLERFIREAFKFGSTPIKLRVRRRAE